MARNQAGEIEVSRLRETPTDLPGFAGGDVRHVRLVVLHTRMFFHHLGVHLQLRHRAEHHFVQHLSLVANDEAHGVALANPQFGGRETHRVAHVDGDRPPCLARIGRYAERLRLGLRVVEGLAARMLLVRERGACNQHRRSARYK